MNLKDMISKTDKDIAVQNLLKDRASATLLRIKKDALLKEHQSATEALLLLLSGQAVYEEADRRVTLGQPWDYVRIPAKVTHKVQGLEDAVLVLVQ